MSGWDEEAHEEALAGKDKRIAELENGLMLVRTTAKNYFDHMKELELKIERITKCHDLAKAEAAAYSEIATKLMTACGVFVQQVRDAMKLMPGKLNKAGSDEL